MPNSAHPSERWLNRAKGGDTEALGNLLALYRDRLRRAVSIRMDRRVARRVDASDVIQEALLEASRRFGEFAAQNEVSFFVWLRYLTVQRLLEVHRKHLRFKARTVDREVSLHEQLGPRSNTAVLADWIVDEQSCPSGRAMRAELHKLVHDLLNQMDPTDREVLTLRHFEQVSNREAAEILGLSESGATRRYGAALVRLKNLFKNSGYDPESTLA